jgi:hypothetical protein
MLLGVDVKRIKLFGGNPDADSNLIRLRIA